MHTNLIHGIEQQHANYSFKPRVERKELSWLWHCFQLLLPGANISLFTGFD